MNNQKTAKSLWYIIITFALVFILLPLLYQVILFIGVVILDSLISQREHYPIITTVGLALSMLIPLGVGYLYGKIKRLPQTFATCYSPMLAPIIYTLLLWCVAMFIGQGSFAGNGADDIVVLFGSLFFFPLAGYLTFTNGLYSMLLVITLSFYSCFMVGFIFAVYRHKKSHISKQGLLIVVPIIIVLATILSWQFHLRNQLIFNVENSWQRWEKQQNGEIVAEFDDLDKYEPFSPGAKLIPLREPSHLHIDGDLPRLDGATAFFPVYAAAVQAIYPAPQTDEEARLIRKIIRCSRTPYAYEKLLNGEVDLIFVAAPSQAQIAKAEQLGLTFTMVPLAREAFVFLVNPQNPIDSLTVEQIQAIYSGEINNWKMVGGESSKIMAFQRPANSGSQTTMENKVMKGLTLKQPIFQEIASGMGGLVIQVADYHNETNALGYSFRYYVTNMRNNTQVKLLSINGIAPTAKNIRNGSYPFIANVYMVTARPVSINTQKLMDWFLSTQGQQLIEDVGYVPIVDKSTKY